MLDVLTRAGCFVAIIVLGFILKKVGLFKPGDFSVLSNIVLKITLPAAIVTNFANKELDPAMLVIALLGIFCGIVYIGLGFVLNLKTDKDQRAFDILNLPGYNIGCFAVPFIQNSLGPTGVIAACIFDVGNGFICNGGAFSVASIVKDGGRFSVKLVLQNLLKSIPFLLYIIMPTLCFLRVPIPQVITSFAQIAGNANAFLAMLMLGLGMKLDIDGKQLGRILRVIIIRFAVAAIFAVIFYNLPFSQEIRKTMVIMAFSPIGSVIPIYTEKLKSDVGLSSSINSVSIICSVLIITILLMFL